MPSVRAELGVGVQEPRLHDIDQILSRWLCFAQILCASWGDLSMLSISCAKLSIEWSGHQNNEFLPVCESWCWICSSFFGSRWTLSLAASLCPSRMFFVALIFSERSCIELSEMIGELKLSTDETKFERPKPMMCHTETFERARWLRSVRSY